MPADPQTLAIVSGKGGSGKTLVATALAQGLSYTGKRVVLVDADLGTGGLSHYLSFRLFSRNRAGLSEFIEHQDSRALKPSQVRHDVSKLELITFEKVSLVSSGSRRVQDEMELTPGIVEQVISILAKSIKPDVIIFDCRGGFDRESLSVCSEVSDILIVAETDAAAIQASQFLADSIYSKSLGKKLRGFVLNKVMDDPSALANAATAFFRCDFLGAIPLDIDTTRRFIKGLSPRVESLFMRHVWVFMPRLFEGVDEFSKLDVLRHEQFGDIEARDPALRLGNISILSIGCYAAIVMAWVIYNNRDYYSFQERLTSYLAAFVIFAIAALGTSDAVKAQLGRFLQRILRRRPSA